MAICGDSVGLKRSWEAPARTLAVHEDVLTIVHATMMATSITPKIV